jgi:A/G-specific adenine glycosylase
MRYWAGLGYYSRARNIKRAAEIVAGEFGGRFPSDVESLQALPGIGRYTAGAIASIAYDIDTPVLDTNVVRVLCRLNAIAGDARSKPLRDRLWILAREAIPKGEARDFNQALMELGALVCFARDPACARCPARPGCAAAKTGSQSDCPTPAPPKCWRSERHVAVAVLFENRLLLVKRPNRGVWAGLWEMPRVTAFDGETVEAAASRALSEVIGLAVSDFKEFATVRHVVMDVKIALTGMVAGIDQNARVAPVSHMEFAWAEPADIARFALASPQRRLLRKLSEACRAWISH